MGGDDRSQHYRCATTTTLLMSLLEFNEESFRVDISKYIPKKAWALLLMIKNYNIFAPASWNSGQQL